ncbi:MAG: HyaD/HybD family hydrogenase maturation endopeptidase [Anaerolineae bacterium]|jgi:hydrogenase maturation protease
MSETLVLGLGNILLRDEGVGVRVIERLQALYEFPRGIRIVDGGTLGLDLLPYLENASRLVVVDAVPVRESPGALVRLTGGEIATFMDAVGISLPQTGLQELLAVAMLKGYLPDEVVFWGVQVESLGVGLELSTAVAASVDVLVRNVLAELASWGIQPREKRLE